MKSFCITLILVASGLIFSTADLSAHGGTYIGPGDTVPPEGTPSAPPATTPPSGPTGPITPPGLPGPSTPPNPVGPPTLPPATPTPAIKTPGNTMPSADLSTWIFWWEFNKARFLNLKARVHDAGTTTEIGGLIGLGSGAQVAGSFAPSQALRVNIIVPALHRFIHQEQNRDVATAVMIALAKVGTKPEEARQVFEKNLDSPVQEVAETAALAYGILKDELAIPLLEGLLLDSKDAQQVVGRREVPLRSRTFAAYALGLIGRATNDERIKEEVANILFNVLVKDRSAAKDIRVACVISIGVLQLLEPTDMVSKLGEVLDENSDSDLVLAHIPNAMAKLLRQVPAGNFTREAAIDQMLKILSSKSKRKVTIRQSAVQAIGMLASANDQRNDRIFKILQTLAKKGKSQQLKHYTAIAMADLGVADPRLRLQVTKFLMVNMKKSSTSYEPWCGLALGVMAFNLKDQNLSIQPIAMEATLAAFHRCKAPDRKAAYALALGLMGYEAAADEIHASMLKLKDSQYRGYAAVALGLLNSHKNMAFISDLVRDSKRDPDLLKQASIGLGLMKGRGAVNLLLDYLAPENGKRPRLAVLAAVATALGFIGDTTSVAPLVDIMTNKRMTTLGRAFAAVSLGMVADKDGLPWNSVFSENLNYRAAVSTLVDQQTGTGILDIL